MSRKLSTQVVTLAVLASLGGSVSAQQAPPPAAGSQSQPAKPAEAQPPAAAPATGPGYSYVREGRRDPFVSLVGRGTGTPGETRPSGLGGMLINEISLKGIMRQSGGFVALVQGTDKKTYVVRQGQKLMDGTVKSITEDTVVFSQDVNDPLSLVKQREVRKTLRSSEEGRG